ncbi:nucleotidyltransferase [Sporosarcina thermotolerans]|uniref:tRNA(Met) cytidine acetate ligase n=1 Tax=Sporosarcina thermotolerans TaxID=633404 RepID=A0AAW9A6K1_9BACL|nr:nucleotidyltransferase [Sporosarcina thermotolerans]MDW0115834.1 nucleotidyltransferase [Sporosarcina thermotolerans]
MKATGVVVEYNPLHNGHVYHAQQAKAATNADLIIAVMSGNFLQRGEPAFIDKWARTKMALASGVDIVFELPYRFATGHATVFAHGAISLLDAAGCTAFCFGSEDGDIEPFHNTLDLLDNNSEEYNQAIKNAMQEGLSYPMALNKAYDAVQPNTEKGGRLVDLSKPNNILGFHYMQAARTLNSSMMPTTIKRLGAEYHDDTLEVNKVASATGIRKSFFSTEKLDEVLNFIPESTKNILIEWQTERMNFGNWESFYPFLRFSILRDGPAHLSTIADLSEGIENLIYRAAKKNDTFQTFMNDIKSKRYTWTRIQRMLTHILTGFTKEMRSEIDVPAYLRLLGMTDKGRSYLSGRKKDLPLPLISKVAAFSNPSLDMDIQASDIYALAIGKGSIASKIGLDYTISPIMNNYFSGSPLK